MKFAPHYPGKPQKVTYETLKDHIILLLQKTLRYGGDVATALRTMNSTFVETAPVRNVVIIDQAALADQVLLENLRLRQQGNDLDYKENFRIYNTRKEVYDDNMIKAYAFIFGYCNKVMQNRIEEMSNFETEIRNDPVKLLEVIKEKMYDPARAKYEYVSLTESFVRLIVDTKQDKDESLIDYTKRFKQTKDILKQAVGEEFLYKFAERTQEYKDAGGDTTQEDAIRKKAFNKWMTYVYLRNSDQRKYGTLMKTFRSQYSLGNNQYPGTLTLASDALTNHQWDETYAADQKRRREQRQRDKRTGTEQGEEQPKPDETGSSFKQQSNDIICYCCGKKGHISPDCPQKDTIPRSQWKAAKGLQMFHEEQDSEKKTKMIPIEEEQEDADSEAVDIKSVTKTKKGWCQLQSATTPPQRCYNQDDDEDIIDIKRNGVILDTGSTFNSMANEKLVAGVYDTPDMIQMNTNVGSRLIKKKGKVPGIKEDPWFDANSKANVFSFARLSEQYKITCDTSKEQAFLVHTENGIVKFKQTKEGLYYRTFSDDYKEKLKQDNLKNNDELQLVMTLEENKANYTPQQVEEARRARTLYHNIGAPSVRNYKAIIQANSIKNCPVTIEHIKRAEDIYGPDISYLKGKTTRSTPRPVSNDEIIIPKEIYEKHQELTFHMDTMFINGIGFLTSVGHPIYYRMCKPIESTSHDDYYKTLDKAFRAYNKAGFRIKTIQCDGEYKAMMDKVSDELDVTMNYTNAQDHESRAERNNRTIKEAFRTALHRTGYAVIPRIMIQELAELVTERLNMFPAKHGISQYYSPAVIMNRRPLDYNKHCKHSFGEYVQAGQQNDPTNTPIERTIDAIYMRPNDNQQGGHRVMNLNTGKIITRNKVITIPLTKIVQNKVEQMAKDQGITQIKFTNKRGIQLPNLDWIAGVDYDDYNNNNDQDQEHDQEQDQDYIPTQPNDVILQHDQDIDEDELEDLLADEQQHEQEEEQDAQQDANPTESEEEQQDDQSDIDDDIDNLVQDQPEDQEEEDEEQPRRSTRIREPSERWTYTTPGSGISEKTSLYYQTIDNHKIEQAHNLFHTDEQVNEYDSQDAMLIARLIGDLIRAGTDKKQQFSQQYILEKGLKKFGDSGRKATVKEMRQLHDRHCFHPTLVKDLTNKERKKAQRALLYLTQKRDKTIKGRMVYNGKPTREWLGREETASPTAALESIILTALIDAEEGRDVMSADVPNAFIQTDLNTEDGEERIIMKITGVLVDILVNDNPDLYGGYVVYERGQKVLYVVVLKAIYGMLVSAILWYKKFREDLEKEGFIFNPYDPCVANRMIRGKQQTIRFHVDDLMSSHMDPQVNDDFEQWLNSKYGEFGEVKTTRGKQHDYLGMTFEYGDGQLQVHMIDYIEGMLKEFPIKFKKNDKALTLATTDMFSEDTSKKLSEGEREIFHKFVAKGLFASKRARQDIQPIVSVLCTRVKNPGRNDWNKLVRMMKFLHCTKNDKLTLSAEQGLHNVEWYVDASFAVHPDYKSHTGASQVFRGGRGVIQSVSAKQKLNTSSSTTAELVGVDQVLPLILWTPLFLEAQGYPVLTNRVYQDNRSTILLEKNGKMSSGKRTRALNIRYFMITDQGHRGNVQIEYCPTDYMLGDYMTKGLQGVKFSTFRRQIMGMIPQPKPTTKMKNNGNFQISVIEN